MDKEIKGETVLYHLNREEVAYLRSNGYKHITLWYKPRPDQGRTIGTEKETPLGRRNQQFIEEIMKKAGFEVNTLPNSGTS